MCADVMRDRFLLSLILNKFNFEEKCPYRHCLDKFICNVDLGILTLFRGDFGHNFNSVVASLKLSVTNLTNFTAIS